MSKLQTTSELKIARVHPGEVLEDILNESGLSAHAASLAMGIPANRLTAINYSALGSRTEFTYDGLGRRVKVVEKNPGMTTFLAPGARSHFVHSRSFFFSR